VIIFGNSFAGEGNHDFPDINPTGSSRLFTAIEPIAGLFLIVWTASAIFLTIQQYLGEDR
jgi:hypothetical protein